MKLRNGFVSNSSSSSFVFYPTLDNRYYCPECFSNKEIEDHNGCYRCLVCKEYFDSTITIKDIRKLKLEKIAL